MPNDKDYGYYAGPIEQDNTTSDYSIDFNGECLPKESEKKASILANREIRARDITGDDFITEGLEKGLFERTASALEERTKFYKRLLDCNSGMKNFMSLLKALNLDLNAINQSIKEQVEENYERLICKWRPC